MAPSDPGGDSQQPWRQAGRATIRSSEEDRERPRAELKIWALAPGLLWAHPSRGLQPQALVWAGRLTLESGRSGFESWHYTPLVCDGAGDCTSLGLGPFTGSVGVGVFIPRNSGGHCGCYVTGVLVSWGCHNKVPLTGG